jgi:hypothetical protein
MHEQEARDNETFASTLYLDDAIQRKWMVVVLFYAAVHWIEAYLDQQFGIHSHDHDERRRRVVTRLPTISISYEVLYRRSREARYEAMPFNQLAVERLVNVHYRAVRTHLLALLHPPAPPTP